jgi:hypothetical protein
MALWVLGTIAPCLTYNLWDGIIRSISYNPFLITPPRIYDECIWTINHFFYEPGNDYLVAYMLFSTYHWPSWAVYLYKWDAETGVCLGRQTASIFAISWANHAGVGSYNHIYTTMNSSTKIYEVPWDSLSYQAGMWSVDPNTWNPNSIYSHAVVNRLDGILCGVGSDHLDIWNLNPTPTRRMQLRLPNSLGYMAYENRENLWIVTKDGLVLKANYRAARWEMLSTVQNPSPDAVNYLCAFDTRRKRLAVLRQRPDAEDGACQCQLEFYRPLYRSARLTDPVPVSPLRAGAKVRFVAHLIGEAGEGVASYLANAALVEPAAGQCLTPVARTEICGAVTFRYQAPAAGRDTLKISATITDGEEAGQP